MAFLLRRDYLILIDEDNLDIVSYSEAENMTPEQLIGEVEQSVKLEISSYLSGRYDVKGVFVELLDYLAGETYTKAQLIYLEAPAVDPDASYILGALATRASTGVVYKCIDPALGSTLPNPDNWLEIGKNRTFYSALKDTNPLDLFTDETVWSSGDTRNALIKRYFIDLALYELHSRISPRNIPLMRIQRRDDAIDWLKLVQNPRNNVDADFLPLKVFAERKGNDISWNSRDKQSNYY